MRGIIRRALNVDSIFWIIALLAFVVVIYVLFGLPNADAVTRTEYDELKAQELAANNVIYEAEIKLTEQRELIKEQEIIIKDLKVKVKELSDEGDWETLRLKAIAEDAVQDAVKIQGEYRDGLGEILTQRSDAIKLLKSLNLNVVIEGGKNLSHLTTKIGVSLSKSCQTMIKNGFESNCPTYKQLVQLDSSDTGISGKFTTEDGFFHRGPEAVKDSYRYYWDDKQIRIFVDPPGNMANRIKMIYIEPNFKTYTVAGDMTIHNEFEIVDAAKIITSGNNTKSISYSFKNQTEYFGIVTYHDRYIDSRCKEGIINADVWPELIGDTIHLMRNGCDRSYTGFEERQVVNPIQSEIDVTTSPSWLALQYQKHLEEFCIFKYKQCT